MSSAATSLEEELNIPQEATLQPSYSSWSIQTNTGASVSIAQDTAIRSSPRCLIVGRQAKVSDIRIQHGSISRKHAALYFLQEDLILHDFGSKKGTQVNGTLVQGQVKLKEGDEIMFGNVRESIFRVHCERKSTEIAKPDNNHTNNENGQQEETQNNHDGGHSTPVADPGAGLTGRAKREAEIAAMMDSLEQTPTYQKYIPSAEEVAAERQAQKAATTKATNVTEDAPLELLDSITKAAKENRLPIAERMTFTTESERRQMVTCVAMDPSGARFAVGSTDNTLRLYDFGGMDQLKRDPFKMLQADEGHVVSDICYSNTGDRLIVGTGSSQPHILDRDGGEM